MLFFRLCLTPRPHRARKQHAAQHCVKNGHPLQYLFLHAAAALCMNTPLGNSCFHLLHCVTQTYCCALCTLCTRGKLLLIFWSSFSAALTQVLKADLRANLQANPFLLPVCCVYTPHLPQWVSLFASCFLQGALDPVKMGLLDAREPVVLGTFEQPGLRSSWVSGPTNAALTLHPTRGLLGLSRFLCACAEVVS